MTNFRFIKSVHAYQIPRKYFSNKTTFHYQKNWRQLGKIYKLNHEKIHMKKLNRLISALLELYNIL